MWDEKEQTKVWLQWPYSLLYIKRMTHNNHKTMNTIFKHALGVAFTFAALLAFSACMGGGHAMQSGGEVTGVRCLVYRASSLRHGGG